MKKRILVVDDNEAILEVVKLALEMTGCEVSTSLTGDCFHHMEHPFPDLILLDVMLSGEDGSEICEHLKKDEQTSHIPIILLSAHGSLQEAAERCGADDFLLKPFRLSELRETVKRYLSPSSKMRH